MLNDYFKQIKRLAPDEIRRVDVLVDQTIGDIEFEESAFAQLNTVLQAVNGDELFEYRNSYARWYALYAWDLSQHLRFEDFVELVSKYTFLGFLLGEDVWKNVIMYLYNRSVDEGDMSSKFNQLKKSFLSSSEVLYFLHIERKNYTLAQCITDSRRIENIGDTLEQSEFFSQLQEKIHARIKEGEYSVEAFDVVSKLRNLINFFVGVEPDTIWYVADSFFYPQKYDENINAGGVDNDVESDINTVTEEVSSKGLVKNFSYQKLRESVSHEFLSFPEDEKDEKIITRLMELSEEYKDEKIRDLYYYDDQAGVFTWNEELLENDESQTS